MAETIDTRLNQNSKKIDLPPRMFLYTIDQVAACVGLPESTLRASYIYFHGRTRGNKHASLLLARNIAAPQDKPEWRIAENEFIRWMKFKKFVFAMSDKLIK